MKKKIVIAGGTGFLGNYLSEKLRSDGYEVIIISRESGDVSWSNKEGVVRALEGAEILINLAGKTVDCRYNEKNKNLILRSRTETTKQLGEAITQCSHPPSLWLNASTATIYRHEEERPNTERDGALGEGFSVEVAKQWEAAFHTYPLPKTRRVAMRISLVLGKDGGVFPVYKKLVRSGLGGRQGDGRQMFSWIHIEDVYRIILFLRDHKEISGAVNLAAPQPVSNDELMRSFRAAMGISIGLPGPKWMLEMGAVLIGTEPELIFKSRWVVSSTLHEAGFRFEYPDVSLALKDLLS